MTFAELFLLFAGGAGIYVLLRPFQRWLERQLRRFLPRHRPPSPPPIDLTDFTSDRPGPRRKDDHHL